MSVVAVTGYVWVLSLHVLAAFAVGGPVTLLLLISGGGTPRADPGPVRRHPTSRETRDDRVPRRRRGHRQPRFAGGASDAFSIFDGWIVASFILWLAIGGLGDRAIADSKRASEARAAEDAGDVQRARRPSVLWLELGAAAATVAVLALMIWKPGA